jgi:hypothetical protein
VIDNENANLRKRMKMWMDFPPTNFLVVAFLTLFALAFLTSGILSLICSVLGMAVCLLLFRRAVRSHLEKRPDLEKPWWL